MKPVLIPLLLAAAPALFSQTPDYVVLATNKTSTMEKEMNEAASRGYRFEQAMGGDTAFGGNQAVVAMSRRDGAAGKTEYRLLATSRTGTMQKEMDQAAADGFAYRGQSVFQSTFGGREVVVIMERGAEQRKYKLLATSKTSTLEKELRAAAEEGYRLVGMTVGKTAMGGAEMVAIVEK